MLPKSPDNAAPNFVKRAGSALSEAGSSGPSNEMAPAHEWHEDDETHGAAPPSTTGASAGSSRRNSLFWDSDNANSPVATTVSSFQFLPRSRTQIVLKSKDTLRARLMRAMQWHEYKLKFIPVPELEQIVDKAAVGEELIRLRLYDNADYQDLASNILNTHSCHYGQKCSRRKLFAILALVSKTRQISDFVREEICDCDSPFIFEDSHVLSSRSRMIINAFEDRVVWEDLPREEFERRQWWLESPYFDLSCERNGVLTRVVHYAINDLAPLPYISKKRDTHPRGIIGGESTVRKVKFHPGHYNSGFFTDNPFFAIKKKMHSHAEDSFQDNNEVKSLKRLHHIKHKHLIRLLVTMQHKGHLLLVFPWADGNLQEYWQEQFPKKDYPPRNAELVRWIVKQCLGLAGGLKEIHHNHVSEAQTRDYGLPLDSSQKWHGRHGDIKPENILWFKSNSKPSGTDFTGVLKIADFGFMDFRSSQSKSKVSSNSHGATHTYMAPEWLLRRDLSPAYDIWCIGCVLLEFVVWYLRGRDGIEKFVERRLSDSESHILNYEGDHFFNEIIDDSKPPEAKVKQSVRDEFHDLRHDDRSSDFILDLLDYIEYHLLRIEPVDRDSCEKLVEKLQSIYNKCVESENYCTKRAEVAPEKPTHEFEDTITVLESNAFTGTTLKHSNNEESAWSKDASQFLMHDMDGADEGCASVLSNDEYIGSQVGRKVRTQGEMFACRMFGNFFEELSELRPLLEMALTRLGQRRFVRNYRRILKVYLLRLQSQSQTRNHIEDIIIRILRSRKNREDIAQRIIEILRPGEDDSKTLDLSQYHPRPSEKESLKKWLDKLKSSNVLDIEMPHGSRDDNIEKEIDDKIEDDRDYESNEETEEDAALFDEDEFDGILSSMIADAKDVFRRDATALGLELRMLVLPSSLREVVESVPKKDIRISYANETSLIDRMKAFVEDNTFIEWNWWPLRPRIPDIPPGKHRLEWQVSGLVYHQSVSKADSIIIQGILEKIQSHPSRCCCCTEESIPLSYMLKSSILWVIERMKYSLYVQSSPSVAQQRYTPSTATTTTNTGSTSNNTQATTPPLTLSHIPNNTGNSIQTQSGGTNKIGPNASHAQSWVIFGIKDRSDFNDIENIHMSNLLMNDSAFFKELKRLENKYRWPFLRWFSPYIFTYCKFVRFEAMNIDRVFCCGEALPEDTGHGAHYEYFPRPPGVKNPLIKKHEFQRYLGTCEAFCFWSYLPIFRHTCSRPHKDSHKWQKIPRKKAEFDIQTAHPDDVAYGIEAVYTLSFPLIFIYHLLSILAWSAFSIWWLKAHPNDLQNASVPVMAYLGILASFWILPGRVNDS